MSKRGRLDSPMGRKKTKTEDGGYGEDELHSLLSAVEHLKDHGRAVAPPFRKLPPRQQYPDYYQLIKKPIALETIRQGLKQGEYLTLDMLKEDLLQMTNNAKRYNEKGSGLYLDAKLIANLVKTWGGEQGALSSSDEEEQAVQLTMKQRVAQILLKLQQVEDDDGRLLADIFMILPDKDIYPDYYKIIQRPISFKEIDKDNKRGNYKTIDKFADDLEQMYKNALTYNEDGSLVAEDAKALKRVSDKLIAEVRAGPPAAAPPVKIKFKTGVEQPPQQPSPKIRMAPPKQASPAMQEVKVEPSRQPTPAVQHTPQTPAPVTIPAIPIKPDVQQAVTPQQSAPSSNTRLPLPVAMQRQASLTRQTQTQLPQRSTPLMRPASQPVAQEAAPVSYNNAGPMLIQSLALDTPKMYPPYHLTIPGIPGQASQILSWTLPISGNTLTLTIAIPDHDRKVTLRVLVNRVAITASKRSDTEEIFEARLSSGANCIECIAEAEGVDDQQEGDEESGRTRLRTQHQANARRDRERMVVMVYLR